MYRRSHVRRLTIIAYELLLQFLRNFIAHRVHCGQDLKTPESNVMQYQPKRQFLGLHACVYFYYIFLKVFCKTSVFFAK